MTLSASHAPGEHPASQYPLPDGDAGGSGGGGGVYAIPVGACPDHAALSRSDALVIAAVVIQILMLLFRLEAARELWVILLFHIVGTVMEVFKTDVGSWSYETDGFLRIGGVPLYTGFMYAAVGSYMVRVFRLFELRFERYPPLWTTAITATAIYVNFFSHHYLPDGRWVLVTFVYRPQAPSLGGEDDAEGACLRVP